MKIQKLQPYRHILALISFSYMIVTTYAYSTDTQNFQIPFLKPSKNLNKNLLEIENWTDFLFANLYIGLFYVAQYIFVGYLFEVTNPAPKTEKRQKMTQKQRMMGIQALFWVILVTVIFMWKLEDKMPYYGYFDKHELTVQNFLVGLLVYMFAFDTWFWFTHVALHHPYLMKKIHLQHHQFVEPSAFAQDAVHPIEALIQGPFGHYLGAIFYPIHPVCLAAYGLLTSIYALAAHDGRWDPNFHVAHHYYVDCQFGIYWGFWDIIFGTRYNKNRYPNTYVPTYLRDQKTEEYGQQNVMRFKKYY